MHACPRIVLCGGDRDDEMAAWLDARGVPYEQISEGAESRRPTTGAFHPGARDAPSALVDGEAVERVEELASHPAVQAATVPVADGGSDPVTEHRPLIIAGSGIAGLTAAIYGARANNEPLVFQGIEPGGQLTLTTDVANYPGFPEGINGPELVQRMQEQAERFGAEVRSGVVASIDDSTRPFVVTMRNGDVYTADAFIAASGASARTLGIPGEDELMGYGLSTCATCDGAFFRGEDMVVVGGGDAAMEEANFLTKFASTVYIVHRREEFRAEDYWVERTMDRVEDGDIELLLNTEVTEVHGTPEGGISHVTLVRHPDGHPTAKLDDPKTEEFDFDIGAVFLAIGHDPNTDYLDETGVEMDAEGYLRTRGGTGGGQMATAVDGLFGAGDVVDHHYQQAITAGGLGCQAAMDADDYLETVDTATTADADATAAAKSDD